MINDIMIYFILLDTKYDPELVGKYHTDAFNTLKEKYENSIGGSSTSSEVMKDMKEILTDYCPSNDANPMNACMNTISEYAEKNHGDKIHGRLLKSVFSEDQLQILEDAITSMDNKKDALEAIRSLKEGLDQNDTKERAVIAALSDIGSAIYTVIHNWRCLATLNVEDGTVHKTCVHINKRLFSVRVLWVMWRVRPRWHVLFIRKILPWKMEPKLVAICKLLPFPLRLKTMMLWWNYPRQRNWMLF